VKPFLLVLSAPSGGGKTTVARALLAARNDVDYSVSATTRAPRAGERDGVDYHFISREEFDRRIAAGAFLEWAEYGGQRYGTLVSEVERVQAAGRHVVLDIEVTGARAVRQRCPNVVSVFIIPPSAEILIDRLGGRNTERRRDLVTRLRRAVEELAEARAYDYLVVNADRAETVAAVGAIIDAESRRSSRHADLAATLDALAREIARRADALDR
jgi:guanylate kinase